MPTQAAHNESVNRRFRYIVVTLYLMVVGVMMWQFTLQWRGYRDAHEAQKQFSVVQAALHAMADVSKERRPAVAVLMLEESEAAKWRDVLDSARRMTDRQMDELGAALRDPDCDQCATIAPAWDGVRAQLVQARQGLDAMQHTAHSDTEIVNGFNRIVKVIPRLSSIAQTGATGVIRENADVQSYLLVARLSGLLREQAGLVAQQFAPALVKHRPLTEQEALEIAASLGKIEQLRQLLVPSVRVLPPELLQDYAELERRYYGDAVALLNQLRQEAAVASGSKFTLMELSDQYGPLVAPIDRFRDDALTLASDTIDKSLHRHLLYLLASGVLAVALTALLVVMIWRFREKVIRPFSEAQQFILAVASGDTAAEIPHGHYGSEVQDLFAALNVLKQNDLKRHQLEHERNRLIRELQTMAETDPLTGLLNRRAFESRARVLLADKRGSDPLVALMMLDIDFFKRVNDTYGHESGDKALVALATLCRETVRADDIVARFGGEEFVILLRVQAAQHAQALAEKLCKQLRVQTVTATDGQQFGFTVSIGIAFAQRVAGARLQVDALLREADALLYRAKSNGRDRIETDPG
ncbi:MULTISPECIES: diguanylate cyclase [unclassified Dyella]|uniref:GGDEF domain-containing protein n=1 Tax=unclassified Dyella TaxID=2634549 RepID=UPI003F905DEE